MWEYSAPPAWDLLAVFSYHQSAFIEIVLKRSYIPSQNEKTNVPSVEENIEQQLRAPRLLLELVEEPHIDGA
jgi:hypothetical protein